MASQLPIHPPLAGIVRGRGFQKMPPYSCREAINFWPQFAFDGSETLGIRPPLSSFIASDTHPVNLICAVNGTNSTTPQRGFVVGVNGGLFKWDGTTGLTAAGGSGTLPTGRVAFAAAHEQKVYIPAVTPLVYDYPTNTLANWTASSGTVPSDARIIVHWQGGLWVAGQPSTPHIVSGCATGKPLDWLFSAEGAGAAFSTIGDNAGLLSAPVTALMPLPGDSMIVSQPDSMQIWRSHPRRGGVADWVSYTEGARGQGAWCIGPNGLVFILTNKGLISVQNGNAITHISEDRIPSELIGLTYDYADPRVSLAYDARFNGIHITRRGSDAASSEAWFFDLKHNGLFQQKFAQYPYAMMSFDPLGSGRKSEVLFAGAGGLFQHDLDGTENISNARIVIGPFRLSNIATERSMIREAVVVMGGGTDAVDAKFALYCGPTGDSACRAAETGLAAAKYVSTVDRVMASQGRIRPMIAGAAGVLVFDQATPSAEPKLQFEEMVLMLEPAGRERGYVTHSDQSGPRAGAFIPPPAVPDPDPDPDASPLLDGLFAYYALDEASGPRADAVGSRDLTDCQDGILPINILDATGKVDQGMAMPADPQDAGTVLFDPEPVLVADFDMADDITIAYWFKNVTHDAAFDSTPLTYVQFGDNAAQVILQVAMDGTVSAEVFDGVSVDTTVTLDANDFSIDVADGEFHLVTMRFTAATGEIEVGIDGETMESVIGDPITDPTPVAERGVMLAGNLFFLGSLRVSSVIDEVGVWNRALTDPELALLAPGITYPFE